MKNILVVPIFIAFFAGILSAKEYSFKASPKKIFESVASIPSIGLARPYINGGENRVIRKIFKEDGVRRVVFHDIYMRAGQSHAFTYKSKATDYRGLVIFEIKPGKDGALVNILIDQYSVEVGKGFSVDTMNFQQIKLSRVTSTGGEENYLARMLATRMHLKVDAPEVPLIDVKK